MEYLIEVDKMELALISLGLQHLTIATELAAQRGQPAGESMLAQMKTTRGRLAAQAAGFEAGTQGNPRANPHLVGTDLWRCFQRAYDRVTALETPARSPLNAGDQ